jgi:Chalcone isomerase-like
MIRALVLVAAIAATSVVHAAELDGVSMPNAQLVDGERLVLNGIGLRTYSIFRVGIYVAGLYLQQRSDDPQAILRSNGMKLLQIRFLRNVTAAEARVSWRNGFENNCRPPCHLSAGDVRQFLAAIPDFHKGEQSRLVFTSRGVDVLTDGHLLGRIPDPHFAEVILSTFIGPVPPTPQLKRQLLGAPD